MSPPQTEHEGPEEADQIERTPGAEPGAADDNRIDRSYVTEQLQRLVDGLDQYRREQAAQRGEHGERLRIEQQRQDDRERSDRG